MQVEPRFMESEGFPPQQVPELEQDTSDTELVSPVSWQTIDEDAEDHGLSDQIEVAPVVLDYHEDFPNGFSCQQSHSSSAINSIWFDPYLPDQFDDGEMPSIEPISPTFMDLDNPRGTANPRFSVTMRTLRNATTLNLPRKNSQSFCKGAIRIRTDPGKGLEVSKSPAGLYSNRRRWRCRNCSFNGEAIGKTKPFRIDGRVLVDEATGIRYKWIFLAKSHVATANSSADGANCFGCLFCVDEEKSTAVYGTPELLMEHISGSHEMTNDETTKRNKCIIGTVEETGDWDIHVP